jgi:hypothetical protein
MNRRLVLALLVVFAFAALLPPTIVLAQQPPPGASPAGEYILLTIFLKHDQSKTLDEINQQLDQVGFWAKFPPDGIAIESWYVMMGIGQVVTLRVPPARLREVNRAVEQNAWKAFHTEFYPTYDFREVVKANRERALKK